MSSYAELLAQVLPYLKYVAGLAALAAVCGYFYHWGGRNGQAKGYYQAQDEYNEQRKKDLAELERWENIDRKFAAMSDNDARKRMYDRILKGKAPVSSPERKGS